MEDRLSPSAVPVIAVTAAATPFIGTMHVPVSITFANPSASGATNPGYVPWDYVVLPNVAPTTGDAGKGLSFDASTTPNFLGAPVTYQETPVPGSGTVTGPAFALGTNGSPIVLTGLTPNDQVVFFQLPFGSYAVDQPGGTIDFDVNVSSEATLAQPLAIVAGGGFSFGNDALNNPSTDPPIVANTTTTTVTPTLFTVTTKYLGPENETATGPNFVQQFEIDVSVAPGQTLTDFNISDVLPDTEQWLAADALTHTANGGVFTGLTGTAIGTANEPGGTLVANFSQVVGTGGPTDGKLVFSFYVPENDADSNAIVPLNTGAFTNITDGASAGGTYTSTDPSDNPSGPVSMNASPMTITAKSIAVQKSVSVVDGGAVTQGSVLQYTIHFQVSDYFAFNQLDIGDLLPDGVRFDQSFTPTLSITQHSGHSAVAAFNAANYLSPATSSFNADGTQTLNFAVSNELISRGQSGDLLGGDIPVGGTGSGNPPDAFNSPLFSGTTGTIVFEAVVQQQYSVKTQVGGTDKNIKQGDSLTNVVPNATGPDVAIQPGGQVLGFTNLSGTGTVQADGSTTTVTIATGALWASIYAINGNTSVTSPFQVQAGDTVTYRLEYLLPTSTADQFEMTDYLPLPVFDAMTVTTFDGTNATNTAAPAAGVAEFGPGVTGVQPPGFTVPSGSVDYTTVFPNTTSANNPTVSDDAGTNSVVLSFPHDLEDPAQRESLVDVLFTVVVTDHPFGDGLLLTNQAASRESNTSDEQTMANVTQQVQLTQPNLTVTKGVVSTNDPGGVFSPGTVGPVTFDAPGNTNAPFTGTVTSTGLAAAPVDSDLSNLHAGDLVKFAIVVENTGESVNGAFNVEINDTLPTGLVLPTNATALNLQVFSGAGAAIPFTSVNSSDTDPLFQSGIELTDPSATQGALAAGTDTDGNAVATGANIAVITYDLRVEPDNTQSDAVYPGEVLTNAASLFNYSAMPGGGDYLSSPLTAEASATISQPVNAKSIATTSEPSTNGSNVVIGEIVRYHLSVQLPAGKSPGFVIVDELPTGLSYLGNATAGFVSANGSELFSSTLTAPQYSITGTSPVSPNTTATLTGSSSGADGAPVTFVLGDITNSDDAGANSEYVVLDFNALVDNVSVAGGATPPGHVDNHYDITEITSGATQVGSQSNSVPVSIVEPHIAVANAVSPGTADDGDAVTYTITFTSNGGNDAFIPVLTDTIPASIAVSSISASSTGGVVNLVNNNPTGPNVDVTADDMPVGSVITVTVAGTLSTATVGVPIADTANATWSSLPGGVGTQSNPTGQTTPGSDGAVNGARDGNTAASGGSANTYNASGSATLSIKNPVPSKSIITTSEASTSGTNVAIGEIVRYQLAVQMPEALSQAFQIKDALPTGLSFLGGNTCVAFVSPSGAYLTSSDSAINNLAGLDIAGSSSSVTATALFPSSDITGGSGDGSAVTFNLSNVSNSDILAAGNDYIVVQFNVLVDNVAHNQTGTTDTNTFTDLVNNGSGATQVGSVSNSVSVVIVQPSITNTTKTVASTGRDPGDTVSYQVTCANTGNAGAFDTELVDMLPSSLTLNTGSIVVKRNGSVLGSGFTNNSSGNTVNVTLTQVAGTENTGTGDSIEIDYAATINTTDPAGTSISNTANLTYTSLPGPFGTTVNPTGSSTPGSSGSSNGERNGSGGVNSYFGSGTQTITVNSSTLTGFVYQDVNDNGVKDAGEPGISSATVTLTGTDFLGNPVDIVTTTNSSGQYTFANLLPSNLTGYIITETQPAGYLVGQETPPSSNFSGTIGTGSSVGSTVQYSDVYSGIVIGRESMLTGSNYNFGELKPASLSGYVYVDANNDGIKESGESGISGVSVTLTGTNDQGNPVTQMVTTLSDGSYSFTNLRPGTYSLTETQPSAYAEGKDTIGTPGGNASVQDVFSNIVLNEGVNGANNNFGERPTADLGITKTDHQTTVVPGTAISYTITVTNNGPSTVSSLAVTDSIPATILSPLFSGATLGTFSYSSSTHVGTWTGLTLSSGQSVSVTMSGMVSPSATGQLTNTATVGSAQDSSGNPISDLNPSNNSSTDTNTLTPQATLTISKTDGTTTYTAGTSTTYTIVVTNNGPSAVTGATLVDNLPGAITSDTWTAAYANGSGTGSGSGNVDVTNVDLRAGGTATFTVVAAISDAATGNLVNTATVTNPISDAVTSATDTDTPNPQADLQVVKTDNNATVPGRAIVYTIVATNNGPSAVTGATLVDNLPATITSDTWTAVYANGSGTGSGSGNLDVTNVNLQAGGTATFTVTASINPSATGPLANTATVAPPSAVIDPNPSNNSSTDTDTLTPQADLQVVQNGPAAANAGDTLTYTVTVNNNGPSNASNVLLSDPLPAGTSFVSEVQTIGPIFTLSAPGGNIADTVSILATGASATFAVMVRVNNPSPPGTIVTNTANVSSGTPDPNLANNSSQMTTAIGGVILSGMVFLDSNDDGVPDAGEVGLGGVTISLIDDSGHVIAVTRTAIDGSYLFNDLATGPYTIVETPPSGYGSSTPNEIPVVLPGGGLTNQNFGLTTGSLTGTVFFDGNNNGIQGAGEPGIGGVAITLTGTDINGSQVSQTITTAADGTYSFTGLLASNAAGYTVTETQPARYTQGIGTAGTPKNGSISQTANTDVVSGITLGAGANLVSYNFGEQGTVVGGTVFLDLNKNKALDAGEPGKGGVSVTLLNGNGNTVATTLTNADGSYLFSGIMAGQYRIIASPPAGFTPDTPTSLNVTVPTNGLLDQVFGLTTPNGSLAGTVYVDLNKNGGLDSGEPGIGGVAVTLEAANNSVIATTTTAANGTCIFTNLAAGIYSVVETQPAGYGESGDTAGTAGGNTSVQDVIGAVNLGANVNAAGYNFGELPAKISGTVFNDSNGDGIFDGGETGYTTTDVTITLYDTKGNVVGTTTTGTGGTYSFDGLIPGNYSIVETPPAGLATTSPTTLQVTVPPGGLTGQNFGLSSASSVSGTVFFDPNNDGVQQVGEPGIADVTVTLTGKDVNGNSVSQTITTAADGSYRFTGLLASNGAGYTVAETQPAVYGQGIDTAGTPKNGSISQTATNDAVSGVSLGTGANLVNYNFGETSMTGTGTITGSVFVDKNNTGSPSGQPPIGGIIITLKGSGGATVATTTTTINGSYAFANVAPGTYSVVETQPNGYGNSGNTAATAIPVTVPQAGGLASGNNFGETLGSLSGTVFADNNNDGILDGPDLGIAGVVVTLMDGLGNTVATTTTNGSGNYSFTGLLGGSYSIVETQPANFVDGKDVAGTLGNSSTTKNQFTVALPAGGAGTAYNFAEIPAADPQGYVFVDVNDNGVRDPGEAGIPNVTITLTGTDIQGNTAKVTITTDSTGFYQITTRDQKGDLLLPGTYLIQETPPTGYENGKLQNGTPPATVVSMTADAFEGINLTQQPFFGGLYNFGELTPSALSGSVYVDSNGNGIRDPQELGLPGVVVTLTGIDDLGDAVYVTVVTDVNGDYAFQNVRPGTYQLVETQPTSFVAGLTTAGSLGGSVSGTTISSISVGVGQSGINYLFGERGLIPSLVSKRSFLSSSTIQQFTGPPGSGIAYVNLPADPNAMAGPVGYGSANFIPDKGTTLPYRIEFENSPTAGTPAQEVSIIDFLDPNLNWSKFQLTSVGFGNNNFTIPADSQFYQTTTSMTYNGETFDVDVEAGINFSAGQVYATFQSLDPSTGLPPSNALTGFLPPEDGSGRGMGYLSFSVSPKANLATGTQIPNVADVSFDGAQAVATDLLSDTDPAQGIDPTKEALVTIDSGAPTSSVSALPATETSPSFTVSWSGQDDAGGSGIARYSIYVSDDGGSFQPWLAGTTSSSAIYTGQFGHSYGFYSIATDNVGNQEAKSAFAEATTFVQVPEAPLVSTPANWVSAGLTLTLDRDGNLHLYATGTTTDTIAPYPLASVTDIEITAPNNAAASLTIDSTNGDPVPVGGLALSGAAGLVKTGSGRVTLSGADSYKGGTTVSSGTLLINAASALPTGGGLIVGTGASSIFGASQTAANLSAVELAAPLSGNVAASETSTPIVVAGSLADALVTATSLLTLSPYLERQVKNLCYVPAISTTTDSTSEMPAVVSRATVDAVFTPHRLAFDRTLLPAGNAQSAHPWAWLAAIESSWNSPNQNKTTDSNVEALDKVLARFGV